MSAEGRKMVSWGARSRGREEREEYAIVPHFLFFLFRTFGATSEDAFAFGRGGTDGRRRRGGVSDCFIAGKGRERWRVDEDRGRANENGTGAGFTTHSI